MRKVKFLHCADLHMDRPFTSLGTGTDKPSQRRQDLKKVFRKIIDIAKSEKVNILLISGDLYEHDYVRKATINFINDEFAGIPDIKVFISAGNHDPCMENSFYKTFQWSKNVHVLTEESPYAILDDIGACIYGMGFKNFYEEKSLVYNIRPIDRQFINILMVHGTVDMNFTKSMYNPMTSENLASLDMDYIALGHFHNRIDNIGGHGIIYNPGSPEPLGFDEAFIHGVYLGEIRKNDINEKALNIDFIRVNEKYYESVEMDISGCSTDEQVICRVEDTLQSFKNESKLSDGLFNITLKGYLEAGFKIDVTHVQAYFKDILFFIKIKDETLPDYNFDEIKDEPGLRGLFTRKILSLLEKTEDAYERKLLLKSLYYGMEALEQGRVSI